MALGSIGPPKGEGTEATRSAGPLVVDNFRVWSCLRRTVTSVAQNWLTLLVICSALYGLPGFLLVFAEAGVFGSNFTDLDNLGVRGYVIFMPYYYCTLLADALVAVIVVSHLRANPMGILAAFNQVRMVAIPLLLFSAIDFVALEVCGALVYVPLLVYGAIFWLTVQSMSVETLGLVAAMRRSAELTKHNRLRFAIIVFIIVLAWEAEKWVSQFLHGTFPESRSGYSDFGLADVFLAGVFGSFIAGCLASAYHDMRAAKEDTPRQRLLEAFD